MIEEGEVALLHVHEFLSRGEIAPPGPGLALGAFCNLLTPCPARRFGLPQPVIHDATICSSWPDLFRPSTSSLAAIIQDVDARDKKAEDALRSFARACRGKTTPPP